MENIYFNLESIESTYGEEILTSVIQMDERIEGLTSFFSGQEPLNGFEKLQVADRLHKIGELNTKIQHELALHMQKILKLQESLKDVITPG